MDLKQYFFGYTCVFLIMSSCCTVKSVNDNSNSVQVISVDCKSGVESFNGIILNNLRNEIKEIYKNYDKIPDDLRELYPETKIAVNNVLSNIKGRYSIPFSATSLEPIIYNDNTDLNSDNFHKYQLFFLVLTKYSYGPYPSKSKDTMKKQGWLENADVKKRIEVAVKNLLIDRCRNEKDAIKQYINPIQLPDKIDDLLIFH